MLEKCQASKQPGPHLAEQIAAASPPTLGLEALFLLTVLQGASACAHAAWPTPGKGNAVRGGAPRSKSGWFPK